LNNKFSNLNFTGHQNYDENLNFLKFDRSDYFGLENVPVMFYGYWEGNALQSSGGARNFIEPD